MIKTNIKSICVATFAAFLGVASACSTNDLQESIPVPSATEVRQTEDSAGPVSLSDQIAYSKEDLAQRQGEDVDSILIVAARQVTWRSGALGCPGQGMAYTQALVPGVLIILQVGNENFSYHARRDEIPFFCPWERATTPASIEAEDRA